MPIENLSFEGGAKQRAAGKLRQEPFNEHFSPEDAQLLASKINEIINKGTTTFKVKLGESVSYGDPLFIESTDPDNVIIAGKADASIVAKMPAIGFAESAGVVNDVIDCIQIGKIDDLDTSSGSILGSNVYVASGGGFTFTKPVGVGLVAQPIGFLARINAADGGIVASIDRIESEAGSGDMTKAVYDVNNTGIVDRANQIIFRVQLQEAVNLGDPIAVTTIAGTLAQGVRARTDTATKLPSFGLATTAGVIGEVINVINLGLFSNYNTGAWALRDYIYVNTTGGLTNVRPSSEVNPVAFVARTGADGILIVNNNLRIDPFGFTIFQKTLKNDPTRVYNSDSSSDFCFIDRIYADSRFLRTTGSLPTNVIFASPSGVDGTGQKGNIYAPYTATGASGVAVSGDVIVYLSGDYGTITTNLGVNGVSYTCIGKPIFNFTGSGGWTFTAGNVSIEGAFDITSSVNTITFPNSSGATHSVMGLKITQTSGVGLQHNAQSSIFRMNVNFVLSGTAQACVSPVSGVSFLKFGIQSSSSVVACDLKNSGNLEVVFNGTSSGGAFSANSTAKYTIFAYISQSTGAITTIRNSSFNGFVTGGQLDLLGCNLEGAFASCIFNMPAGGSNFRVSGNLSSITLTASNATWFGEFNNCLITTLTNTSIGVLKFNNTTVTGFTPSGTNAIISRNSDLTLATGVALVVSNTGAPLIDLRYTKVTGNHSYIFGTGRNTSAQVTCYLYNCEITNTNGTGNIFYKDISGGSAARQVYKIRNSDFTSVGDISASIDAFPNVLYLEGGISFTPKITETKTTINGGTLNDLRIKSTASGSDIDFTNDENGMLIVNSTAFGRNITNTNFKNGSNFKFLNTNASTVTITVNAPLNFLNGTTATTKTIAQNEIFEFVNINGNDIIIK